MSSFQFPLDAFNVTTFSEIIGATLKDKLIEVYVGDVYEQIERNDGLENVNGLIVGKVVAGLKDCLVLNSFTVDKQTKQIVFGNLVFVNGLAIKSICELDGKGSFADVFVDTNFHKKL